LFYIDNKNIVREKISTGGRWTDGPLTSKKLIASQDPKAGMQACWYGSTALGNNTGMHLWYASDAQTIQTYIWEDSTSQWTFVSTFTANGQAGVGCYASGPGTIHYSMMVNLDNDINVLYKYMNHTTTGWKNTSVIIPGAFPRTSLAYTNNLYTQLSDGSLAAYDFTFDGRNTTLGVNFTIPNKVLLGSYFSVNLPSSGPGVDFFAQQNGTDIVQILRDPSSSDWSYDAISVPND
jgi:hypothetical protein